MTEGMRTTGSEVYGGGIGFGLISAIVSPIQAIRRKKRKKATSRSNPIKRRRKTTRKKTYKTRKKAGYVKRKVKKRIGKTYYTKNGQPYKILRSGKARFIKGRKKR